MSVVVVEHLLERDFRLYFERLQALWNDGHDLAKELLEYCWPFGDAENHWHLVEHFLQSGD